ncbi:hypothetical protein F2P81_011645 [Scophthalmus maximus]|uniref:Uncharacterized protein n=1 Tax=Scophthalmus maximus TaxID=52904 RepID=A0A6A4SQR2_SCOMX|nr:hypothetical protein F2P81_011645 [Scophthalmus maximus]
MQRQTATVCPPCRTVKTVKKTAFSQIALGFRCDQYTLKQRLQAEEHARNLAEENVQLELSRGRETLEEARVSRAVELMIAHVENVTRRRDRHLAELEEAKKMTQQQNSSRNIIDPRASPDPGESDNRKRSSQQYNGRRRVSVSIIPSQTEEKRKPDSRKRAAHGGSSSRKSCPSPSLSSESSVCATTKEDSCSADDRSTTDSVADPHDKWFKPMSINQLISPLDTVRQRRKGKAALSKKKSDKDKKRTNIYRRISAGT